MHPDPLSRPRALRRRAALAAVAAALAAAPASPRAQEELDPSWRAGAGVGVSFGLGDEDFTSAAVRIDAERPFRALGPQSRLGLVVSFAMSHPAGSASVPIAFDPYSGTFRSAEITWDANVFELVPAARLAWAASPTFSLYADGGVGLAYTVARVEVPAEAAALGLSAGPSDGVAGVLRLAGGLQWILRPDLRLAVQLVGLDARFGGGVGSSFDVFASLSHRL